MNLVLDLLIAVVAVGLVALAVTSQGTERATAVGLSLNVIILANTTLLRLVEAWASLEVSLGAIARLRSVVTETPQEENTGEQRLSPPVNWPISGSIVLRDLEASYRQVQVRGGTVALSVNEILVRQNLHSRISALKLMPDRSFSYAVELGGMTAMSFLHEPS